MPSMIAVVPLGLALKMQAFQALVHCHRLVWITPPPKESASDPVLSKNSFTLARTQAMSGSYNMHCLVSQGGVNSCFAERVGHFVLLFSKGGGGCLVSWSLEQCRHHINQLEFLPVFSFFVAVLIFYYSEVLIFQLFWTWGRWRLHQSVIAQIWELFCRSTVSKQHLSHWIVDALSLAYWQQKCSFAPRGEGTFNQACGNVMSWCNSAFSWPFSSLVCYASEWQLGILSLGVGAALWGVNIRPILPCLTSETSEEQLSNWGDNYGMWRWGCTYVTTGLPAYTTWIMVYSARLQKGMMSHTTVLER